MIDDNLVMIVAPKELWHLAKLVMWAINGGHALGRINHDLEDAICGFNPAMHSLVVRILPHNPTAADLRYVNRFRQVVRKRTWGGISRRILVNLPDGVSRPCFPNTTNSKEAPVVAQHVWELLKKVKKVVRKW